MSAVFLALSNWLFSEIKLKSKLSKYSPLSPATSTLAAKYPPPPSFDFDLLPQTIIPQLRQNLLVSSLVRPQVSQVLFLLVSSTTGTKISFLGSLTASLFCLPGLVMISAQVSALLAKAKWTFALKDGWLEIPVNLRFLSRLANYQLMKGKAGLSLNGAGVFCLWSGHMDFALRS